MSPWTSSALLACLCTAWCAGAPAGSSDAEEASDTESIAPESATSGAVTDSPGETSGETPKLDVGGPDDPCTGDVTASHIWVANAAQGTLSKIDTRTLEEVGRYWARPDGAGDPSRTSVNLNGDVAVANRRGGLTAFRMRESDCIDDNGVPDIQTSTGKDDVLAWNEEECVAWHTPFALGAEGSHRPVAFTAGDLDEDTCRWNNHKIWTSTYDWEDGSTIWVHRVDGESGELQETVAVEGVKEHLLGAYGGAVDSSGDFWFLTPDMPSTLVRVGADTLAYEVWVAPLDIQGYGIAVDHSDRVWLSEQWGGPGGTARFDPASETWDIAFEVYGYGLQEDTEGRVWIASPESPGVGSTRGVRWIDGDTLAVGPLLVLPTDVEVKGVSIDVDGYVWAVDMGNTAFRIDPDTLDVQSYDGLDGAYTYSDMTGWGLANVTPAG